MLSEYFLLGIKNLKRRGVRSWLTLLGIFIGVTAIVALISLGSGLKAAVTAQFGTTMTETIIIQAGGLAYGPPGSSVSNPLTRDDAEEIEKLSVVEFAIPQNIESIKVKFNDITQIIAAYSEEKGEKREYYYELEELEAVDGKLLEDDDRRKIVLGNNYLYGEKNGFDKDIEAGDKLEIQGEEFRVKGILSAKGSFIIDTSIGIFNDELEELIGYGDETDVILAKIKSKDLMDKAEEDIEKLMRKRRDVKEGEEDFTVETPEAALETVNQILGGVQIFIVMIALVSIIVGAVGIVNTMTTSVLERKREIGIMKAVGARNSDIFLQFFIEAGLMGLIGGLVGVIFGSIIGFLGIIVINNFIGAVTSLEVDLLLILGVLFGSFVVGSISGIAPAMRAARQNPVEAIRD